MMNQTSDLLQLFKLLKEANKLKLQKEYETAIKLYMQVVGVPSSRADIFASIAFCYFALAFGNPHETGKNFVRAINWMEKAVMLAPNDSCLHTDLAHYCWLGILDYPRAAEEYRNAIELNPNNIRALVEGATLYGVPENVVSLEEAVEWLERAVQLEPNDPRPHFGLGKLYYELGRIQDAQQEWFKALLCPQPLDKGSAEMIISFVVLDNK